MAGPPEAPNCSARVLLNSATEQDHGRSRIEIDIGDNTVYVGYYDTTDKFCEETLFQTSDPANLELYQPAGSANGDKPFTHPFVWIGKCDSDKKKFTYVNLS
ncbi:uncharacterized protein N7459_009375 [Penicillium hispanicum]|uniref:uncharacterized protein n=1 Tax=Penicillium hispanicum TaxID=1080232 RepID=UPI00254030F4|nr:uncharacterized protein N7459_009375 [Penicillium hispanicum]KAJ5569945.1 hypothetical protein N7459_009375 [Penicillium hispanicum]